MVPNCMSVKPCDCKPERLLSMAEMGRALNVSQTTMCHWKEKGLIEPDFIQGTTLLFCMRKLAEYREKVGKKTHKFIGQ
jgi:hypothetical protein